MARTERTPQAKDMYVPVYVPSSDGTVGVEVGKGSLKGGQLVVKFKDTLPAVAIQRMLERGTLLGMSFVMIAADARNQSAQEEIQREEIEARNAELDGDAEQLDIPVDDDESELTAES